MVQRDRTKTGLQNDGKSWCTAMFAFLKGIRLFSKTKINFKDAYAPVSMRGYYINHENAEIRKGAAPFLSRMIHSEKYAEDMRRKHREDPAAFSNAARVLHEQLMACGADDEELYRLLADEMWKAVKQGFVCEKNHGRPAFDLPRAEREMDDLFAHYFALPPEGRSEWNVHILASYYHVLAYGHIDVKLAYLLTSETPGSCSTESEMPVEAREACLVRVYDGTTIGSVWKLDPSHPMTIGRYTDCDITDTNACVSRLHCRIECTEEGWTLKDTGSKHGTVVIREGMVLPVSAGGEDASGPSGPVVLRHGDRLRLARHALYWFGRLNVEPGLDY